MIRESLSNVLIVCVLIVLPLPFQINGWGYFVFLEFIKTDLGVSLTSTLSFGPKRKTVQFERIGLLEDKKYKITCSSQ